MSNPLIKRIQDGPVLMDGAMGTEIYKRGIFINRCYDELNLSNPTLISQIHKEYVNAGADIIETNTFGANAFKLRPFGLEEKVVEINQQGIELARKQAGKDTWVAAAVGPTGIQADAFGRTSSQEILDAYVQQIQALEKAQPDLFILETFFNLRELKIAWEALKQVTSLPHIVSVSFRMAGDDDFIGLLPEHAVENLSEWGVEVLGTNCSMGPQGVLRCVERMKAQTSLPIAAIANAGVPETIQGRTLYMATPEYMASYARRMIQAGARIVGGCCGTTPEMIKEMKNYLQSMQTRQPSTPTVSKPTETKVEFELQDPIPTEEKSNFGRVLQNQFGVSVELDPPRGLNPKAVLDGAAFLKKHGIDAINIADGPRAVVRMSPMSLGVLIQQQVEIESIIHYCCRDRNLLGMQMDLLGAQALGLHNILIITGDPPKMGNYPDATAVFDVDSIGLIRLVNQLNQGMDMAGENLKGQTQFVIGTGCNPAATEIDLEVERFAAKIEAGAEFVFSQPVYDPEYLERFLEKIKGLKPIPFYVGILPLASLRNAEFLHSEVPGMQIPEHILKRMRAAQSKEDQRKEGIRIAQEALAEAYQKKQIKGTYIFPPFNRVEAVLEVLSVLPSDFKTRTR